MMFWLALGFALGGCRAVPVDEWARIAVEDSLWVAVSIEDGTELLLARDFGEFDASVCGAAAATVRADGSASAFRSSSVGVVAYARPDTIARLCVSLEGSTAHLWGPATRHTFRIAALEPAPSLAALAASIEARPSSCLPTERGLFFEAIEMLCFALGFKPVLLRQRQTRGSDSAANSVVLGAPGALFSPHAHAMLRWLFASERRGDVRLAVSRNEWGEVSSAHEPAYEETLVFAREETHAAAVDALVRLRAQDASVPGQPDEESKLAFIALVGRLLGYPRQDVGSYALEMLPSRFARGEAVQHALDDADAEARALLGDELGAFVVGRDTRLPTLPGVRDFLRTAVLHAASLRMVLAPLDSLF